MYASLWRFGGDPDDLLARYDALISEIGAAGMELHVCLRADDGILMLDACPSEAAFDALVASEAFRALRERHGLPEPDRVDGFAVHAVYAGGTTVHSEGAPPIRADPAE
ncbi:MAG TPA: hypothetical protein VGK92_02845 [Gaiellales bacterium]